MWRLFVSCVQTWNGYRYQGVPLLEMHTTSQSSRESWDVGGLA